MGKKNVWNTTVNVSLYLEKDLVEVEGLVEVKDLQLLSYYEVEPERLYENSIL